jgi:hypothetical protein
MVTSQTINFEEWMSRSARAKRKAKSLVAKRLSGMMKSQKREPLTAGQAEQLLRRRKSGKLMALTTIAKLGFNERFKQIGKYRYRMVG